MSEINDGGPAFPRDGGEAVGTDGMSLRDWFAGQALAGTLASLVPNESWPAGQPDPFDALAASAYRQADAMLKARREGEK